MTETGPHSVDGLARALLTRLDRIAPVVSVRPLVGGRGGRTFAVTHRALTTVVHLRSGGPEALEHEATAARRAHAAGVGPEVIAVLPEDGALVTRWVTGAVLTTADLRDDVVVRGLAAAVRRLHDEPNGAVTRTYDALDFRTRYLEVARGRGLLDDDVLLAQTERTDAIAVDLVATGSGAVVGIHADLVPSNLVLGAGGVVLLDHEYAGLADPALDLGSLAATAELGEGPLESLLAAYLAAGPPGSSVTIERVRAWRDVTRHAWLVWVALGDELGPERARWEAWAARVRARWASAGG